MELLLVVIGAIMVPAILRYKDVDSVLKIWGALGTLTGLAFGVMGTYFFSKEQLQQKDAEVRQTASAIKELADQTRQATQLLKTGGSTGPHMRKPFTNLRRSQIARRRGQVTLGKNREFTEVGGFTNAQPKREA